MASHYTDIPIIDRSAQIINFVSECPFGITAIDLASRVSIPKTTFYRILNSLVKNRFLTYDPASKRYYLGSQFATPANMNEEALVLLSEKCHPFLQNLVNEVHETAKISVLSNLGCYVLAKIEGTANLRISVENGTVFPLHAGAASKILLTTLGIEGIHKYFEKKPERYTPYTIVSEPEMLEELKKISDDGFSIDLGEYIEGIGAVACPIKDKYNRIIAAVSIAFPIFLSPQEKAMRLFPPLKKCSELLSTIW